MQKQAKQIKKELTNIHIESEVDGVVVVMSAEMEVVSISFPDELMEIAKKEKLSKATKEALEKAKKKAEQVAAEKMKGIMGGMGLPGM